MTKDRPDELKRKQTHAERIIAEEGAQVALVCVVGGKYDEGFSVAVKSASQIYAVPELLRQIADRMEAQAPNHIVPLEKVGIDPITGKAWS